MLSVQSYIGSGLTLKKITAGRTAVRAAGCGLRAAGCGLRAMIWQRLRCGLTACQVAAGQVAGQEMTNLQGWLRAEL